MMVRVNGVLGDIQGMCTACNPCCTAIPFHISQLSRAGHRFSDSCFLTLYVNHFVEDRQEFIRPAGANIHFVVKEQRLPKRYGGTKNMVAACYYSGAFIAQTRFSEGSVFYSHHTQGTQAPAGKINTVFGLELAFSFSTCHSFLYFLFLTWP